MPSFITQTTTPKYRCKSTTMMSPQKTTRKHKIKQEDHISIIEKIEEKTYRQIAKEIRVLQNGVYQILYA
jgi:hypothetical protein